MEFNTSDYFNKERPDIRLDLLNIIAAFKRYWKKILIIALIGGLAGYFFTKGRTPVFQAWSVVVLEPENGTLNFLEISDTITATRSTVETQLDVLQSTELLGQVIDTLSADYAMVSEADNASKPTLPNLPREEQIKWLSRASSVKRKGESYAITITAKANHPQLAADLSNGIGRTYVDRQLARKRVEIALASEILKERTDDLNDMLAKNERELANLVQSKQLDDKELDARLNARIAQLKTQHQNALKANASAETLGALRLQIESLDTEYLNRTVATIRKQELQRQIAADRLRHDRTLEQLLRIEAQDAVLTAGAVLVSAAHAPLKPIGMSAKTSAVLSFIVTAFFALLGTLAIAMFDRRIRTNEQIEAIFDTPSLATIPLVENSSEDTEKQLFYSQMLPGKNSNFARAIRQLFFNLHIRLPKGKSTTLGVTSALPDEGKSTIAMCLALAATAKNQRIAVVDFDMWHNGIDKMTPQLSQNNTPNSFEQSGPHSLKDWFSGVKSLAEIRSVTPDFENVDFYPWNVGTMPQTAPLDDKNIKRLFEELRNEYDLIIVDTAPFMLVSEVSELTAELDGFLVVVAWEKITDKILEDLKRAMDMAGANVIGCLLNRVDPKKQSQYGMGNYSQYYKMSGSYS
jgi:uncharacterized protein involved in exopolysaccharide biosynthesis/Mrp family chromosome partitioning ATPase